MKINVLIYCYLLVLVSLFSSIVNAQESHQSLEHEFTLVTIAEGLKRPWGMAFLPDGNMLVTERGGALRLVNQNGLVDHAISGLPDNIYAAGQGGLLDVALHPDFKHNQLVYLSYAGLNMGEDGAGTEVARGRFTGDSLDGIETIFVVEPKTKGKLHYGSRLLFTADGKLLITTGDRYTHLHAAQDPSNHLGAIIRLNDDGSIPDDNPFLQQPTYKAGIYSYGHRNPQGLALRPADQSIWSHEHGPRGGDEVNIIYPGANYGWPAITYGIDYSGAIISEHTHAQGMQQPVVYWVPSIAPSGMAFYNGEHFPNWQGNLFVGALAKQHLRRLVLKDNKVVQQEVLLQGMARIRDVRSGSDGHLYILTDDNNGKLLRLQNSKR